MGKKTASKKKDNSTEFSHFIRNASSAEKKKVFMRVLKRATEEQRKLMDRE